MSLLSKHLEQISLSSHTIATLPFPPPKIFTNALLSNHDITALIRDTEPHERALFSVPPPLPPSTAQNPDPKSSSRRQTVFNVASGEVVPSNGASARAPRRNTAVAAVLGGELHSEIRRNEQGRGEFDVEVLLRGAEKLNEVYPTSGVMEKIYSIRTRHAQLSTSLDHYETKVARQTRELERMNRGMEVDSDEDELDEPPVEDEESVIVTDEDLRVEEDEIRELERRKRELEARIRGMEMDLGGLLR